MAQGLQSQPSKFMGNMNQKYGQQKLVEDQAVLMPADRQLFDQSEDEK